MAENALNKLSSRGVFPVMPAQAGIQLFQQNISGFPPARLCRNSKKRINSARHAGFDPASRNVSL